MSADRGAALSQAASALVGCPFRLHGRDPATGLDCIGLVAAALTAIGVRPAAPSGYGLRNLTVEHWLHHAYDSGLELSTGPVRAGDVLLIALGACQHHLVIATANGTVIHAHAGLRRVVRQPLERIWQVHARWHPTPMEQG